VLFVWSAGGGDSNSTKFAVRVSSFDNVRVYDSFLEPVVNTELIECHTAEYFVSILDPSHERWVPDGGWKSDYIFRGHADAKWELIPAAFRTDNKQLNSARAFQRSKEDELQELVRQTQFIFNYHFRHSAQENLEKLLI